MFLARKKFWLTLLKIFLMLVVTLMIWLQIPELFYDLASGEAVEIRSSEDLTDELHGRTTFVVIHGLADLVREVPATAPASAGHAAGYAAGYAAGDRPGDGAPATQPALELKGFVYKSHGVPFSYFLLEGYGSKVVVRAPEHIKNVGEWRKVTRHMGRLKRIRRMPFSRTLRRVVEDRYDVKITDDAFFLARDDVPRAGGWQIGAAIFAVVLWLVLGYLFFFHTWKKSTPVMPPPDALQP